MFKILLSHIPEEEKNEKLIKGNSYQMFSFIL